MQQGYGSRGSGQPEKLRFPRFSRPHSCVHSERQPKECAGSRKEKERKETKKNKKKGKERRLVRYRAERARAKGKGEGCHSHAPTLNEHSPSAFPLQAGGRRISALCLGRPWQAVSHIESDEQSCVQNCSNHALAPGLGPPSRGRHLGPVWAGGEPGAQGPSAAPALGAEGLPEPPARGGGGPSSQRT